MDTDSVKRSAKNVGGRVKEGFGKAVGDKKTEVEGKTDQVKGKAQNAVGGENERFCQTQVHSNH